MIWLTPLRRSRYVLAAASLASAALGCARSCPATFADRPFNELWFFDEAGAVELNTCETGGDCRELTLASGKRVVIGNRPLRSSFRPTLWGSYTDVAPGTKVEIYCRIDSLGTCSLFGREAYYVKPVLPRIKSPLE